MNTERGPPRLPTYISVVVNLEERRRIMEHRVTVRPTVIVSDLEGDETCAFVTATPAELGEALIGFPQA